MNVTHKRSQNSSCKGFGAGSCNLKQLPTYSGKLGSPLLVHMSQWTKASGSTCQSISMLANRCSSEAVGTHLLTEKNHYVLLVEFYSCCSSDVQTDLILSFLIR